MMLLVVHAPPPMENVDEPQTCPEGEITSTFCSQAALFSVIGRTAYPLPPRTMCKAVPGRVASQVGGADIEVACASNCPSQAVSPAATKPERNRPSPTRS